MRINPAARHSETKYGFIILTGDVIFKHFFVGMKLLLGHRHLSNAAANNQVLKDKAARRLIYSPFDRRNEQFVSTRCGSLCWPPLCWPPWLEFCVCWSSV